MQRPKVGGCLAHSRNTKETSVAALERIGSGEYSEMR